MRADVLWYGDSLAARAARATLTPTEWLYRGAIATRNALYDHRLLAERASAVPAISVGNLTVGGTGKTPFASYVASRLQARGAQPGIVLRGYGGDEEQVHRLLMPGVPVVADADRVRGTANAAAQGADVVVLDDAFQHRRVARRVDAVLVSADVPWVDRCLPCGPLREPRTALRRASLLVVTCKAASEADGLALARRLALNDALPSVVAMLRPGPLRSPHGVSPEMPWAEVRGRRMLAIAGIGNPKALLLQLEAAGASVDPAFYPDHHAYSAADVEALVRRAAAVDLVVCTLKDAVKLDRLWPRQGPPLVYVSQRVELVSGEGVLEEALDRLLGARASTTSTTPADGRPSHLSSRWPPTFDSLRTP